MKIRSRLTLLYTIVTVTILLVFATTIYYTAKENREKEFYTLLKKEAVTKANLFFNANVDKQTLQDIYINNRQILDEVEVAIYDSTFTLLYHDAVDIDFVKETKEMIDQVNDRGSITFYQQDWQVVGIKFEYKDKPYIIIAAAYDQYGYKKLNSLLYTIVLSFILSILVIYLAGRFFSQKAFEPIKKMTQKAAEISATNLDLRIPSDNSKDELSELAITFNLMLDRLENSFEAQKQFVSNISHELRTPLAAIIAELDLSMTKDRTKEEYKAALSYALNDAQKLVRLSNDLLDLAKASYDPCEITFKSVRIDEVLLEAIQQLHKANKEYKVDINFENDFDNDAQISIYGNAYLLKVAFMNLFENGCKFSKNKQVLVKIFLTPQNIILHFIDEGIGISTNDLKQIFSPFFRGENNSFCEGNGIGLPLTLKIINLHQGTIQVKSAQQKGTTFIVKLPLVR